MTDFPAALKTFSDLVDGTNWMEGANVNVAYDEIEAVQTFLGALGAGNTQSYAATLLAAMSGYRNKCNVTYKDADEVTVSAGSIVFTGDSGKYRIRVNATATDVGWGDIDTGSEADTTYYVYALADAEATTMTFTISTEGDEAVGPDGATYWKKIGSFVNNTDIEEASVKDYFPGFSFRDIEVYDYTTSASVFTVKDFATIKIAYGSISIGGSSSQAITNLPFTSNATYEAVVCFGSDPTGNDDPPHIILDNGTQMTITHNSGAEETFRWIAIGT